MGLFSKKKKTKKNTDFNPLNANEMIAFVRSNLKNPTEKNVAKAMHKLAEPDKDQEHLTPEGTLPWGWYGKNKAFVDQIRSEYDYFLQNWLNSRNKEPQRYRDALSDFVGYMYDVKKLCESKNECFVYWRNVIFTDDYLQARVKELNDLSSSMDEAMNKYERQKEIETDILPTLRKELFAIIRNNPGIMQTDVYKRFDADVKEYISTALYYANKDGDIYRVKSGRSYQLYIK